MDNQNAQQDTDREKHTYGQDVNPVSDTVETTDTNDMPPAQNSTLNQDTISQINTPVVTNNNTAPLPAHVSENSAGTIVLQWLTYAFWGWTLLAVNTLILMVMFSLLKHVDLSSVIPYAIASTFVLLPISLVCDFFYGKREPVKKTGPAVLVMVVHAVIFALFAIGSLIAGVFNIVQMMVSSVSDPESMTAWIISFGICTLLYGFTFLRTLNPLPSLRLPRVYPIVMSVVIVGFIIAAFIGPVANSAKTRDDRDIDANLYNVSSAIDEYIAKNHKLPTSLDDVTLEDAAGVIVKKGLVTYIKEDRSSVSKSGEVISDSDSEIETVYYRYQLCVDYKEKDASNGIYRSYRTSTGATEYNAYPDTTNHPAGKVCYKLESSVQSKPIATESM